MEIFGLAMLLSFILTVICGRIFIPILHKLKFGQQIREAGPHEHYKKAGTPTIGGIVFLLPIIVLSFIFSKGSVDFTLVSVLVTVGFGLIGFIDDYIKVIKKRSLGLKAYQKILGQLGLAVIFAIYAYKSPFIGPIVYIPFTDMQLDMGLWYIPFIVFTLLSVVNSTNLTDGIDGLLSGVTLVCMCAIASVIFLLTQFVQEEGLAYLYANYKNLFIFCGIVMGGCMGFLVYNTNPAKVFMGDCGSMALGGAVSVVCILLRMPLMLIIVGGIYLLEALSVIIQVTSYKLFKKRVFRMTPIHHHFELAGMEETRVVAMFTIAQGFFSLLALMSILPLI